jgi:hypothetical protein
LLTPIVLPLVVWVAGLAWADDLDPAPGGSVTDRGTSSCPLLLGLALARFLPGFSTPSGGVV